jgi:2-keto-3-deoxy-L-fuconate dehydrogenase
MCECGISQCRIQVEITKRHSVFADWHRRHSVVSSLKGATNRCVCAALEATVIGLTEAIAADFVSKGMRCNALCPGTIDTPSFEARIANQSDVEDARANFIARQLKGRLGKPDEIASDDV